MTEATPIILIGAARSGTKFLRDILAASDRIKAVPYDVNYVWRYGAETPDDVLSPETLSERRCQFIRKTLQKLAKTDVGDILLEKTVSNTLRVPFVDAVFPNARYIHLIRDGRDVTESAIRQWERPPDWSALLKKLRTMPLANVGYVFWFAKNFLNGLGSGRKGGNVWGPRFPGINELSGHVSLAEICARQWRESVRRASLDLAALPGAEQRVFEVRYEDLITNEDTVKNLITALGLPDEEAILNALRRKLKPSKPAMWKTLPQADQDTIEQLLSDTLISKGYTS